jgi:hypothetical protein
MASSVPCRVCGGLFLNVEEHITKSHATNRIHFQWVPSKTFKGKVYGNCYEPTAFCYGGVEFGLAFGSGPHGENEYVLYDCPELKECEPGSAKHAFAKKHGSWRELNVAYNQHTGELIDIHLYKTAKSGEGKTKNLYTHTVAVTRDPKPTV